MDDQAGLVPTSSNAVVPHSSSDDSPSPVVFALGRLPPELRAKVIIASAGEGWDLEAVRRLSYVHPEFNQLLARFRWESIQLYSRRRDATPRDTLEKMTSFAESMSPTYGSLVKGVDLRDAPCDDRPTGGPPLEDDRARLLAQIMTQLPNVQTLRITGSQHLDTISLSFHPSSLIQLSIHRTSVSTSLIAIISQSHNLANVILSSLSSQPDQRPHLIAALASRRLLRGLTLHGCDFVDESFLTADWQCPLVGLVIKGYRPEFPLPIYCTFLSSFSSTLKWFELADMSYDHWFQQGADLTPFPLPRLNNLQLYGCIPDTAVSLLELFASSPLEHIILEGFIPDETSVEALGRFIRLHHQVHHTLTSVDTLVGEDDFDDHHILQPIAKLIEEARVLGIVLDIEN